MNTRPSRHRVYLAPPLARGESRPLPPDQAHYLARVLRLSHGAELHCFDGQGVLWQATLIAPDARHVSVQIGEPVESVPAPARRLHLVQGLLKGAAMDEVIQKATELGATDVWLLEAARSNVGLDAARTARKCQHWRRIIESAAAQCRQLHLPVLHGPLTLDKCLDALANAQLILLDPGAPPLPLALPADDLAVLIGPEGGWTDAERARCAERGARPHGLGPLVLRAETAPLAILAALRHGAGWQ